LIILPMMLVWKGEKLRDDFEEKMTSADISTA
jgi:hypothetical protein